MNKNAEKSMRVMIPMTPQLAADLKADQKAKGVPIRWIVRRALEKYFEGGGQK